jgi:YD repeat-containing protein
MRRYVEPGGCVFVVSGWGNGRALDSIEIVVRFMGRATVYGYDAMGRLLSRTYPDASEVSFTYTADGRRATAVDARGTTGYTYDNRRRLVQESYPDGRSLVFAYDAHAERTGVTAQIGSQSLTTQTSYDGAGRPVQVTDPLGRITSLGYDAAGNRTSVGYPNTTSSAYRYDALNRLTSLTTTQTPPGTLPPVPVQSYAYTLDAVGKRTAIAEGGGTARSYAYDGIDRLTGETASGSLSYAKVFSYDPVGNRLAQLTNGGAAGGDAGAASVDAGVDGGVSGGVSGATVTYAYDPRDRLTSENSTHYAYDLNGNLTSKSGVATYDWDYENRLTQVGLAASGTLVPKRS